MDQAVDPYAPLAGEGDTKVVIKTRRRRDCENCGEPATKRISFCFVNGRSNPASSMYGRDDCSFCSDEDKYSCDECARGIERDAPRGMSWASTYSAGGRYNHMLLYWDEREATADEAARIGAKA